MTKRPLGTQTMVTLQRNHIRRICMNSIEEPYPKDMYELDRGTISGRNTWKGQGLGSQFFNHQSQKIPLPCSYIQSLHRVCPVQVRKRSLSSCPISSVTFLMGSGTQTCGTSSETGWVCCPNRCSHQRPSVESDTRCRYRWYKNGTVCVPENVPPVGTYRGEPCGLYHSGYIRW